MTRFARAKGSKSSNSRVVEDATNWNEFKRQIDQKSQPGDNNRGELEVRSALKSIKEGDKNDPTWADFGVRQPQGQPQKKPENTGKKRRAVDAAGNKDVSNIKKKVKKLAEDKSQTDLTKLEVSKANNSLNVKFKCTVRSEDISSESGSNQKTPTGLPSSNKKKGDTGEFKRRKPFVQSSSLNINGVTINISKYDGFDVKTEDAVRLRELRSKMLKKGIPRVEVDKAIKLERRRAEKALAREKKKVCFNCRKAGHLLSECPEVSSSFGSNKFDSSAVNLCYKCGSTEHTHFQCQVKKKKEYSFATCFICKEQGHISSQCPDNPKGLYPQGGCCKVCGEVTHLKKDCPQLSKERSENTVTLDTLSSGSKLESLGDDVEVPKQEVKKVTKQKKIVKF